MASPALRGGATAIERACAARLGVRSLRAMRRAVGGFADATLLLVLLLATACAAPASRARPATAVASAAVRVEPPRPAPAAAPVAAPAAVVAPVAVPPPFRIAFGSCNDSRLPQTFWGPIRAQHPDVWIWLGDNVYADTEDMAVMRQLYDGVRAEPGYAALRAEVRVIGTWDDHDYGHNNAGREYPRRAEAQQVLLDFLDEPAGSPRRAQQGVYASYDFGVPPHQVRVILLDTRYHRDPPGPTGDLLGPVQWAWLEQQLRRSSATVNVIGSSIQVVPDEHRFEKWANFPAARARLLQLIAQSAASNVVIISGDRHFAEISRLVLQPSGATLYDVTSSSLNRPWRGASEVNHHRVGELYPRANFGLAEVDWTAMQLLLQVRDETGAVRIEQRVPLQAR
jgi:alkaline phosphatase D